MATKAKALVVEDEESWRMSIAKELGALGFKVLRSEDAETALELLEKTPDIQLLVLDWDLGGRVSLPTACGEDVLAYANGCGPRLKTIVVTGAIDRPDFIRSRNTSPDNELWLILRYRPLGILRKRDLEGDLSALVHIIEEMGVLDSSPRAVCKAASMGLEPPLRYHWPTGRLLGQNNTPLSLPPKFSHVLMAMLDRDPLNPRKGSIRGELSYEEVAFRYVEGWGIQKLRHPQGIEFKSIIGERAKQIEAEPRRISQQWARDFRRFLRQHGLQAKNLVIRCDRVNEVYALGDGWDGENPVLDRSEVSIAASIEDLPA